MLFPWFSVSETAYKVEDYREVQLRYSTTADIFFSGGENVFEVLSQKT